MELNPIIEIDDVSFGYTDKAVVRNVNLSVREGEIVTLLGPNGSGKSTLLKLTMGLLNPKCGTVRIDGIRIGHISQKDRARRIAYVPQVHKGAFPYSVLEVVLMGRMPHKTFFFRYSKEDIDIAHSAMDKLSIGHLSRRPYTEISGGERQLTLIARALAQGARIFVMDEPASGLDYGNQMRLLENIAALSKEGYTFIKSTHSPEHALWVAHRAVLILSGKIIADGNCSCVVNSDLLYQLYKTRVNVVKLNGFPRVCVPHMVDGSHSFTGDG